MAQNRIENCQVKASFNFQPSVCNPSTKVIVGTVKEFHSEVSKIRKIRLCQDQLQSGWVILHPAPSSYAPAKITYEHVYFRHLGFIPCIKLTEIQLGKVQELQTRYITVGLKCKVPLNITLF